MTRFRIFIGGVHGVGKGSLCKRLVDYLMCEYVSASRLLNWATKTKQVKDVLRNQEILADLLQDRMQKEFSYVIDGHFALWNESNECIKVPLRTFTSLNLDAIIIATCASAVIQERLANRDDFEYKLEDIINLQTKEYEHAKYIAESLAIPLIVIDTTKEINLMEVIKQIEQMKKYTRDNILSPMLKTVIMRMDFVGLTDILSFVSRVKSNERMQHAFEKMTMLPKQNMKECFKPKDIEDGQLPVTESQKSVIYRFYDCKIGRSSKVTLDIEPESITLAVDCQENYSGSIEYSSFMGWIIDELRSFDPYVIIKRLGVRKIDVQILSEDENIASYFNEKYIVAQSWNNMPKKTKSILTDLFEIESIHFNVVQYIDRIKDNRTRLIYDIDAFLSGDELMSILQSGSVTDILYHKMQDRMFDLFISVASEKYLDSCKKDK